MEQPYDDDKKAPSTIKGEDKINLRLRSSSTGQSPIISKSPRSKDGSPRSVLFDKQDKDGSPRSTDGSPRLSSPRSKKDVNHRSKSVKDSPRGRRSSFSLMRDSPRLEMSELYEPTGEIVTVPIKWEYKEYLVPLSKPVNLGSGFEDLIEIPEKDPFFTGPHALPITSVSGVEHERGYTIKVDLAQLSDTYSSRSLKKGESITDYFHKRLTDSGAILDDNILQQTPMEGAQSIVFRMDNDKVIKIKITDPGMSAEKRFQGNVYRIDSMSKYVKSDLAVGLFLQQACERFKINGKQIVGISMYELIPDQIKFGILTQRYISGPSAFKVAEMIQTGSSTHDILDPKRRIEELECFYREMNADVLAFRKDNDLKGAGGNSGRPPYDYDPVVVGLDYNHGRNVLWDKDHKMWMLIDW